MLLRLRTCGWLFVIAVTSLNCAAFDQKTATPALSGNEAAQWEHRITGSVISIKDTQLQLETREKHSVQIDAGTAKKSSLRITITRAVSLRSTGHTMPGRVPHAEHSAREDSAQRMACGPLSQFC